MFEPQSAPRVFALPPGVDFAEELKQGILDRLQDAPPEALANVDIFVNTRRMQRRLIGLFSDGEARLLPRIRLVTDLADLAPTAAPGQQISTLGRQLELTRLITALLDAEPDLGPKSAAFDLAGSLGNLMDEMQGEDVPIAALQNLDLGDHSVHWARSQRFITIAAEYLEASGHVSPETRQRLAVAELTRRWGQTPPKHAVIVAGSTGSRGTTQAFMRLVAGLPQGALVLPGFDFEMTSAGWAALEKSQTIEDHPQYRFRALMDQLGIGPADIQRFTAADAPNPARNRLISLALRPAPVTDEWLTEGPKLTGIEDATRNVTLIEAPSQRFEAQAIALRLRQAVEAGEVAALISPDRVLTRMVEAALDRWDIIADDSAGVPLAQTAPGRLLRQVAELRARPVTSVALLALLKHPLCNSGADDRGQHLLWTRELELWLRRKGAPFPGPGDLSRWAEDTSHQAGCAEWAAWVGGLIGGDETGRQPLGDHVAWHLTQTEAWASGPKGEAAALWDEAAGRKAREVMDHLLASAAFGGPATASEYASIFASVLSGEEVRRPDTAHPNIMVWGTLEARVQGAGLVILGGLNDGTWPAQPAPDPWLSRAMRVEAGLLLPDRSIGLAAHDFQQAVAAREIWLTRSVRGEEEETIPSRWLNRLENLLVGLPEQGGDRAWKAMRARGQQWLAWANAISAPEARDPGATRPSPNPPADARPRQLSVTQIRTLIRDPYEIYARKVLRLKKLDPLRRDPDAPLRGTIIHKILEIFVEGGVPADPAEARDTLMQIAAEVMEHKVPWPATRQLWRAKLQRIADHLLAGEAQRQSLARPAAFEAKGSLTLSDPAFELTAKADRIDLTEDSQAFLYDYKTGAPPSEKQQRSFDKQLLLSALIASEAGFEDLGPTDVQAATFIGLGAKPRDVPAPLDELEGGKLRDDLARLVRFYLTEGTGFTTRRAAVLDSFAGDFDHLSRFGEWSFSDPPRKDDLS